jgi:hypothetical protein
MLSDVIIKHKQFATCFHSCLLLSLFFDPEDEDMFLWNVSWLSMGLHGGTSQKTELFLSSFCGSVWDILCLLCRASICSMDDLLEGSGLDLFQVQSRGHLHGGNCSQEQSQCSATDCSSLLDRSLLRQSPWRMISPGMWQVCQARCSACCSLPCLEFHPEDGGISSNLQIPSTCLGLHCV